MLSPKESFTYLTDLIDILAFSCTPADKRTIKAETSIYKNAMLFRVLLTNLHCCFFGKVKWSLSFSYLIFYFYWINIIPCLCKLFQIFYYPLFSNHQLSCRYDSWLNINCLVQFNSVWRTYVIVFVMYLLYSS